MTTEASVVAAIGLGANLGDPPAQLADARASLAALPESVLTASSRLYRSAPMGPPQPDYANAVCVLATRLSPRSLLQACQRIEREAGRCRGPERWLPRTLDLDLLVYGNLQSDDDALLLPHPGISARNFVLIPLAEAAPELEVPGLGRAGALAATCSWQGLAYWPAVPWDSATSDCGTLSWDCLKPLP